MPAGPIPLRSAEAAGLHPHRQSRAKPAITASPSSRACPSAKSRCVPFAGSRIAAISQRSSAKREPIVLHNLYVPAGGDEPDRAINEKFGHKLDFVAELEHWFGNGSVPEKHHGIVVGDLNIAPLENDVWSHKRLLKIVSHTPVETAGLTRAQAAGSWVDLIRQHVPPEEKVYTWWSYRAHDWRLSDRGRRLDHIWTTPDLARRSQGIEILREARGWPQPSDHVPVMATLSL